MLKSLKNIVWIDCQKPNIIGKILTGVAIVAFLAVEFFLQSINPAWIFAALSTTLLPAIWLGISDSYLALRIQNLLDPRSILVELYDFKLRKYVTLAYPRGDGSYSAHLYHSTRSVRCILSPDGNVTNHSGYMWFWRPIDKELLVEMALRYDLKDINSLKKLQNNALWQAFIDDHDRYNK